MDSAGFHFFTRLSGGKDDDRPGNQLPKHKTLFNIHNPRVDRHDRNACGFLHTF
jgi:hypothetical protein